MHTIYILSNHFGNANFETQIVKIIIKITNPLNSERITKSEATGSQF